VSDTASGITVIDQGGNPHKYDADDFSKDEGGHLFVTKDGKSVAIFAPGYIGVHRAENAK